MTRLQVIRQINAYREAAVEYAAAGDRFAADALRDLANCMESKLRAEYGK